METTTAPENALQPKTPLKGTVVKITLAAAVVDIGQSLPGIVHISQLRNESVNRVEDVVQMGQAVDVWVRRVRKDSIELTMIEPLALEWREIKTDMVTKGKVTRIESYGAFVEIGAERPGLVHVSEITHGYLKSPHDILKEGDEVEVKVLEINRRKKQIRLSIKANLPKPEEKSAEAKADNRQARSKKPRQKSAEKVEESSPSEPELTSMEIAWREALARSENNDNRKTKSGKLPPSQEQEDILNRTLENRLPTG